MAYDPSNPPNAYDSGWIRQELHKIREALFSPQPFAFLQKTNVAPAKPREGMIVLADGVNWNPGSGTGYYGYFGGRWVLLGGQNFAHCRLDGGSATNSIKLSRHGGSLLTVGGQTLPIPSGGIQIVPSGVTGGALYNVYGYNNAGTLALEYNTTAHATNTDGTEIKSGDASRLLVGMFRPLGSGAITDSISGRCVASWFNRKSKIAQSSINVSVSSTTNAVIGSAANTLRWGGESVDAIVTGAVTPSTANITLTAQLFDQITSAAMPGGIANTVTCPSAWNAMPSLKGVVNSEDTTDKAVQPILNGKVSSSAATVVAEISVTSNI